MALSTATSLPRLLLICYSCVIHPVWMITDAVDSVAVDFVAIDSDAVDDDDAEDADDSDDDDDAPSQDNAEEF